MPATAQHNEQATEVPNLNAEESARLGENPARFLVEEIDIDTGAGTSGELIVARIRGIATRELVNYWEGVERWLARREDREPRDDVLEALQERREELEEQGDGLAQAGLTPAERREAAAERDTKSVAVLLDEDGEEVPWSRQESTVVGANQ
ncbi:hypothetical protein [Halorubrum distributum]|uniref:DUF8129 domain-containing protein n=1 Tax=Halorubrum distributum TaxID=29283 RepID=A0A6B1IBY0_9EURY|nr:hypothetical protein [Halorubrum terrestre]MYL15686.1 hypothetical protein [Halorubrum terrestre]MYL67807.1 hypothetical protein [Halorubrum terrestre]